MTRLTPQRAFCPDFGWTTILVPAEAIGQPNLANPFAAAMREKARADAILGKGRP